MLVCDSIVMLSMVGNSLTGIVLAAIGIVGILLIARCVVGLSINIGRPTRIEIKTREIPNARSRSVFYQLIASVVIFAAFVLVLLVWLGSRLQ